MAKQDGIYKCNICGNIVSVLEAHQGELVCCGQPMELLLEKTIGQEGTEKHVPIVKITKSSVKVKVGSKKHPMEEKHYIMMIQIVKDGKVIAGKRLAPGEKPSAIFSIKDAKDIKARALCNVHGLWIS